MNKLKNNKGMSLIELLVSLAILSISILSIGNIVGIGINTNKKSEIKQQGLILGQQILEEIELIGVDEDYKNNIRLSKMKLPSEIILQGSSNNSISSNTLIYTESINQDGIDYDVEISLNKNETIKFEDEIDDSTEEEIHPDLILDLKTEKSDDDGYTISILKNGFEIANNINPSDVSIKVFKESENSVSSIYINNEVLPITTFSGDKLMLNFTKKYIHSSENELSINMYNNIQPKLNVYIQKSYICNEQVNIVNRQGNISLTENLRDKSEIQDIKIQNLYDIKVTVKNKDKVLFEGYGNKNLKINE